MLFIAFFSDSVDHTPELALSFIQESVKVNEDRPMRGPFLAHLELIKQVQVSTEQPERSLGMSPWTIRVYLSMTIRFLMFPKYFHS